MKFLSRTRCDVRQFSVFLGFLLVLWVALPKQAQAQNQNAPTRGFTLELGLGVGLTAPDFRTAPRPGLAPLSIGFGYFPRSDLAVELFIGGTNFSRGTTVRMHGVYGAAVQWWYHPRWFVRLGGGLALFGIDSLKLYRGQNFSLTPDVDQDVVSGVGFIGGVGYAFWQRDSHQFHTSLEAFPAIYSGALVRAGLAWKVSWQWW